MIFDSTGTMLSSFASDFKSMKTDNSGNLFLYNDSISGTSGTIRKIDSYNNPVSQFTVNKGSNYTVSRAGNLWCYYNGILNCYDSTSTLFTIPLMNANIQLITDKDENLYVWVNYELRKYSGDSLIWSTFIGYSGNQVMGIDDNFNIYYVGEVDVTNDFYDYDPVSYYVNVPPTLYGDNPQDIFGGWYREESLFIGRISNATPDTFYADISYVTNSNGNKLCLTTPFDVDVLFHQFPLQYGNEIVYIELSDTTGSFNNPFIIGTGRGIRYHCNLIDSIPQGSGYRIRMRLGSTGYKSNPFNTIFIISKKPSVSLFLDNSISNAAACLPWIFVANYDSLYYYSWFTYDWDADEYDYFSNDSSVLILTTPDYFDELGVKITNTATGCFNESRFNYIEELDSIYIDSSYVDFGHPDTVFANDLPVRLTSSWGVLSGPGIYQDSLSYKFIFYPDSVSPGYIPITNTLNYYGTPCIPTVHTEYIYVDTALKNIITGEVDPVDKKICEGDSFTVPYTLIDSSIYDSTNVFYVQRGYVSNYNFIIVDTVGMGISNPIYCTLHIPSYGGENRFRVVSSQTGENGILNPNGMIHALQKPYVNVMGGFTSMSCFKDTIRLISGYGITWNVYDSTGLIYSDSTNYQFIYIPPHVGYYTIDVSKECTLRIDSINVDHSAHSPVLSAITKDGDLCGNNSVILSVITDSLSNLQWYLSYDTLMGETNDSLNTNNPGSYKVTATSNLSCPITKFSTLYVPANPYMMRYPSGNYFVICPGDTFRLDSYSNSNYTYKWWKDGTTMVSNKYYINITDSGYYYLVVTGTQNCIDTSETIYISYKVNPPAITPPGPITIANNASALLSTVFNADYHYQWYKYNALIPGATLSTLSVNQTGQYKVVVSDTSGCQVNSAPVNVKHVVIPQHIPPSTLRESDSDNPFSLYPNPNNGTFTLSAVDIASEELSLHIYDLYGRLIREIVLFARKGIIEEEITLAGIADGIYTVQLTGMQTSTIISLIISR